MVVGLQPPSSRRVLFPRSHQQQPQQTQQQQSQQSVSPMASPPFTSAPLESVVIRTNESQVNNQSAHVRVCIRVRPLLSTDFKNNNPNDNKNNNIGGGVFPSSPSTKKSFERGTKSSFRNQSTLTTTATAASPRNAATKLMTPAQLKAQRAAAESSNTNTNNATNNEPQIPAWYTTPTDTSTISQSPHTSPDNPERAASYTFDRVYSPTDNTNSLYNESIRNIISSVVEGYHGSVFAYGQTNSGKTFTMTGTTPGGHGKNNSNNNNPNNNREEEGVIRLAVKDIFQKVRDSARQDSREYLMRVSYLEIYNEQIYDLLALPNAPASGSSNSSRMTSSLHHHHLPPSTAVRIFESRTEGVVVRGLREEIVTCPEDVFALLDVGDAKRKVGSTGMNRSSSRSHSVFRLVLESRASSSSSSSNSNHRGPPSLASSSNSSVASDAPSLGSTAVKGPVRISSLSLVDLAGSESVKATGATGTRQKEGQYINKSLLTLGHVVHKLSDMSTRMENSSSGGSSKEHIPYRDSKLTRLLQPSLGGNAKVCIVCNISPALANLEESHNTLKFATRAKRIQQHARITEVADEKTLLRSYREEIEELKRQLREAKESSGGGMQQQQQQQHHLYLQQTPARNNNNVAFADGSSSDEEDQDDTHVLVSAIQNLESLIMNAKTKSSRKVDNAATSAMDGEDGGLPSRALEAALIQAESDINRSNNDNETQDLDASSHLNDNDIHSSHLTTPTHGGFHDDDHHNTLLEELHRIQGMLGTVMKKRKSGPPASSKMFTVGPASFQSPERDAEVERLRIQLQEQEVATTMRKADSSFLQGQLSEKENVLKEVSVLLEALEKRQLELERENAQLREDLAVATAMIEEGGTTQK